MPRAGPGFEKEDGAVDGAQYDFDLFTIGIGSGGTRSSRMSSQMGARVAAVELPFNPVSSQVEGGIGGTCVLRGCVPKKILMYGSMFKAEFEDARGFGWEVDTAPPFNWQKLLTEKTREITRLNNVYKKMLANAGVTVFEGEGKIVDPHTVEVHQSNGDVKTYTSKYILIATGGRAVLLDVPGKEYAITSDEALALADKPVSIAIVGGGYIAVEFAGIFNGVGTKVDLIYRQALPLRGFDEEMRAVVADNLVKRGVAIHPEANTVKIEKLDDGKLKLTTDKAGELVVDMVMFATGRKPNTHRIGLDKVGVELGKGGEIKVDEYSRTSVPSIFAVGDVTDRLNLTPVAIMEGTALARTLFANQPTPVDHALVPSAVFCQPPMAVVGLTEDMAVERSIHDVLVFASSFTPMKYTISGRQEKAHMKLIVCSSTDKVLGAAMVGPDAPEIMQAVAIAMKCGATKAQFDSTVGIHPSAAEEFVTMRSVTRRVTGKAKKPEEA